MNPTDLLNTMSPEIYQKLKQAVETGKWLDGKPLDENQKALCLQAVMLYQSKVEQPNEHMTIDADGNVVHKSKRELKQELQNSAQQTAPHADQQTIAKFKENDF
jgi:uncharacterized protein YeaC (DUF1315 family)